MEDTITADGLADLREFDTPGICNALEILQPDETPRFTVGSFVCAFPSSAPVIGYARTATMRGVRFDLRPRDEKLERKMAYWTYVREGPSPGICVVQDLDGPSAGFAALWGEVNSHVHKALGCVGVVTDGSVRDLDKIAAGFQVLAGSLSPFGGYSHVVEFGVGVNVRGMTVNSGDLLCADRYGAVVIPKHLVKELPRAALLDAQREKLILDEAKRPGVTVASLTQAYVQAARVVEIRAG
jgi:regulator of RNase E activity RraA